MEYSELLKDPRWQKKRLEIFQRDAFTCCGCHATDKTLHVHHIKYIYGKNPWEYDNDLLYTLCYKCHKDEEALKSYNLFDYFTDKGVLRIKLIELLSVASASIFDDSFDKLPYLGKMAHVDMLIRKLSKKDA